MVDWTQVRKAMVDGQIRTNDVTNHHLLEALLLVPREQFVPQDIQPVAYLDRSLSVGGTPPRFLLEPMNFAKLVQVADITAADRVLDIGCATGYSTAVLARLAAEVVAVEVDAALAATATANLAALGVGNAKVVSGALTAGAAADGPYNVILLEGAVDEVPAALTAQLADGGRLICVLGRGRSAQAMIYTRSGDDVSGRAVFTAAVPMLPGFEVERGFVF